MPTGLDKLESRWKCKHRPDIPIPATFPGAIFCFSSTREPRARRDLTFSPRDATPTGINGIIWYQELVFPQISSLTRRVANPLCPAQLSSAGQELPAKSMAGI